MTTMHFGSVAARNFYPVDGPPTIEFAESGEEFADVLVASGDLVVRIYPEKELKQISLQDFVQALQWARNELVSRGADEHR
jgi:hypothetical protein